MLLQTVTGNENFPNASAKTYVFFTPTRQFPGKEVHIGVAARRSDPRVPIRVVGSGVTTPAAPGMLEQMGKWVRSVYDVPEGAVFKVFAHRSGGFGEMRVQANLLLRMREGAAHRRIGVILTGNPRASLTHADIEGRFDILTVEEALRLGVTIPPQYISSYMETMTRRAFELHELAQEVSPAPVTETRVLEGGDGKAVEVAVVRKNRALDL